MSAQHCTGCRRLCKSGTTECERCSELRRTSVERAGANGFPSDDLGPLARWFDHIDSAGCWISWLAPNKSGYALVWPFGPEADRRRKIGLHVASYQHFVGEVPDGLVVDHLCRNRLCFNYEHLEPVTQSENTFRAYRQDLAGIPYPCGHPRTPENTSSNGVNVTGTKVYRCKTCHKQRQRKVA